MLSIPSDHCPGACPLPEVIQIKTEAIGLALKGNQAFFSPHRRCVNLPVALLLQEKGRKRASDGEKHGERSARMLLIPSGDFGVATGGHFPVMGWLIPLPLSPSFHPRMANHLQQYSSLLVLDCWLFCCCSAHNRLIKAGNYTDNSPHLLSWFWIGRVRLSGTRSEDHVRTGWRKWVKKLNVFCLEEMLCFAASWGCFFCALPSLTLLWV